MAVLHFRSSGSGPPVVFLHGNPTKLLLYATPGAVIGPDAVRWAAATQPGLTVVDVGPGGHFLPEERPREIAAALSGRLTAAR